MDPSVSMNMGPVSNLQTTDVSSPIFANRLYLYRNVSSKPFFIIPKYFFISVKEVSGFWSVPNFFGRMFLSFSFFYFGFPIRPSNGFSFRFLFS